MDILCYDGQMLFQQTYHERILHLLTIYDISELTISTDILTEGENAIKNKHDIIFIPSGQFFPQFSLLRQNGERFSPSIFHFKNRDTSIPTINFTVFQNINKNIWQIGIPDDGTNRIIPNFDEVEIGKVISKNLIPGQSVITCRIILYNNQYYKLYFDSIATTNEQTLSYNETLQYIDDILNKLTSDNLLLEQYDDNKGWLIKNIFYFKDDVTETQNGLYKLIATEL